MKTFFLPKVAVLWSSVPVWSKFLALGGVFFGVFFYLIYVKESLWISNLFLIPLILGIICLIISLLFFILGLFFFRIEEEEKEIADEYEDWHDTQEQERELGDFHPQ